MKRYGYFIKWFFILLFCLSLKGRLFAQANYETIVVGFTEKRIGQFEIEVLKRGKDVYIPFVSVFKILRTKVDPSWDLTSITGFYVTKDSAFRIDINKKEAVYKKRKFVLYPNDYIITDKDLFLREGFFRDLFGIDIKYNDRKLEVLLKSKAGFAVLQQSRRQKAYQRLVAQEIIEPTINYGRDAKLFSLGKLNYSLTSTRYTNAKYNHRYHFALGSQILGGDLETSVKGFLNRNIREQDITGNIKYPFFNNRLIGLITLGDIQRRMFIGGRLLGIDITNRPPERRYNFGSASLTRTVSPQTEFLLNTSSRVPIYFNTANETTFTTQIPLYYGYREIIESRYNWYGEERSSRSYIIVPPTMVPPGEIDYDISVGRTRSRGYPWYGAAELGYGATNSITLGSGIEYSDRKRLDEKLFPYTFATMRVYNSVYFEAQYSPFIRTLATLSWRNWDQKSIDLQFKQYARNSVINPQGLKNSSSVNFILPFPINSISYQLSGLFTYNHMDIGDNYGYSLSAGANFRSISITYTNTKSTRPNYGTVFFDSRLALTIQATPHSTLSAIGQYDHKENRVRSGSLGLILPISSLLTVNVFVDRNFILKDLIAYAGITLSPPFTKSRTSIVKSNLGTTFSHTLSGEILGSTETGDIIFNNYAHSTRGYVMAHAFFDENGNNIRDGNENYLKNVGIGIDQLSTFGFSLVKKYNQESYLISGQNYRDYIFRIKNKDLEEPFWTPKYERISIKAEPNKLKTLNIPVVNGGVIKGLVLLYDSTSAPGVTLILTEGGNKKFSKKIKTGSSGEYEFLPIPPGNYTLKIDDAVLSTTGYFSDPAELSVTVTGELGKEYVDTQFTLRKP
jgi:hypothetical protein